MIQQTKFTPTDAEVSVGRGRAASMYTDLGKIYEKSGVTISPNDRADFFRSKLAEIQQVNRQGGRPTLVAKKEALVAEAQSCVTAVESAELQAKILAQIEACPPNQRRELFVQLRNVVWNSSSRFGLQELEEHRIKADRLHLGRLDSDRVSAGSEYFEEIAMLTKDTKLQGISAVMNLITDLGLAGSNSCSQDDINRVRKGLADRMANLTKRVRVEIPKEIDDINTQIEKARKEQAALAGPAGGQPPGAAPAGAPKPLSDLPNVKVNPIGVVLGIECENKSNYEGVLAAYVEHLKISKILPGLFSSTKRNDGKNIESGDEILGIYSPNGKVLPISKMEDLKKLLLSFNQGDTIGIIVAKKGENLDVIRKTPGKYYVPIVLPTK